MKQLLIRLGANPDTSLPFSGRNVPEYVRRYAGGAPTDVLRLVTNHLVTNHLGTVHLVTNVTTGAVIQRLDSDEFGRVFADSNPGAQPFGFAGGLYDAETGLVRFGARDYAPEVGRWTARDPVRFDGGSPNQFVWQEGDLTGLAPTFECYIGHPTEVAFYCTAAAAVCRSGGLRPNPKGGGPKEPPPCWNLLAECVRAYREFQSDCFPPPPTPPPEPPDGCEGSSGI